MNSLESVCRTCLNEFDKQQPTYNIQTMDTQIRQWLQDSTIENPSVQDTFPKFVCYVCRQKLDNFLEFHKMSLRSRQLFQEMLKKSPEHKCPPNDEVNCDWLEFDFVAVSKSLAESQRDICKEEMVNEKEEPCSATPPNDDDDASTYSYDTDNEDSLRQHKEVDINLHQAAQEKTYSISSKEVRKQKSKNKLKPKSASQPAPKYAIAAAKPQHICEECGKSCSSLARLVEHQYSHKPKEEYPFHCKECNKAFKHRQTFNAHQMRHAGIKNYQCPYCSMSKTTKSELRAHINHHTKERQWLCPKCSLTFSSGANLRRHDQVVHQGIRRYSCSYCKLTFGKQESLKHHEMRHTGEKPHACLECSKRFIQLVALKAHMKIHNKCQS